MNAIYYSMLRPVSLIDTLTQSKRKLILFEGKRKYFPEDANEVVRSVELSMMEYLHGWPNTEFVDCKLK